MTASEFSDQLINLKPSLERFAYRFSLPQADTKDLIQETFLKVLLNQDKFVRNENFKAWIFTIMKNTFINSRHRIRQRIYWDEYDESFFINQTKSNVSLNPDVTYSVVEINQNIEKLQDKLRQPLKLYINGYKYKEIANQLNLRIGTVKSRIFLSRKKLQDQLNK